MARRRGFVKRGGVARRETAWIAIAPTNSVIAAAGGAVLFAGLNAAGLALRPFTIVRTRGIFQISSDQVAATEFYHAALGIAVVSDQALAIGITAVPTPDLDRGSDLFFVFEEEFGEISFSSAIGFVEPVGATRHWDSKAMRKVEIGSDIAVTIEASSISNGVNVRKAGRMLVKLH